MMKPDDHGGSRLDNNYCKYCTDAQGNLLPKDQVREKMIQFHMQNLDKTQSQAEVDVDRHLALMPAWKVAPESSSLADKPFTPGPSAAVGVAGPPFGQPGSQFSGPTGKPPMPASKPTSRAEAGGADDANNQGPDESDSWRPPPAGPVAKPTHPGGLAAAEEPNPPTDLGAMPAKPVGDGGPKASE